MNLHAYNAAENSPAPDHPFADMADDIHVLEGICERAIPAPVERETYRVGCLKCRGTGRWSSPSGMSYGKCFACKGIGYTETRTDPTRLAANRERSAQRRSAIAAAAREAFHVSHPAENRWIQQNDGRFDFATAMSNALGQYGELTQNQLDAVRRCMARDDERAQRRAAEQAALAAREQPVEASQLEAAFAKAIASGLKRPRITLQRTAFKLAGANSRNPGAIYVVAGGDAYLGKILSGRFTPSRDCSPEQQAEVVALMADPVGAAESYGRLTGNCCICSRALTDPESVARGIGPICAERFGF